MSDQIENATLIAQSRVNDAKVIIVREMVKQIKDKKLTQNALATLFKTYQAEVSKLVNSVNSDGSPTPFIEKFSIIKLISWALLLGIEVKLSAETKAK